LPLQHVSLQSYLAWKRDRVLSAPRQRGSTRASRAIRAVPPGTAGPRDVQGAEIRQEVELGFYEPESNRNLVDIGECPVLVPALRELIAPLKTKSWRTHRSERDAELTRLQRIQA